MGRGHWGHPCRSSACRCGGQCQIHLNEMQGRCRNWSVIRHGSNYWLSKLELCMRLKLKNLIRIHIFIHSLQLLGVGTFVVPTPKIACVTTPPQGGLVIIFLHVPMPSCLCLKVLLAHGCVLATLQSARGTRQM